MKKKAIAFDLAKILLGITLVLPIILAAFISFMPKADIIKIPFELNLSNATIENYIHSFTYMNLGNYLKNSFIMVGIELPCKAFTALLAAYAFSHFDFPGKNFLFTLLMTVMMIPGEVIIMSLYKMIMNWGLIDTYAGLTITGLVDVAAVFMLRQNMLAIPKSLYEAAKIDGCGRMRYFFSILIPLCKTVLAAYALRGFINIYNSYMWPLLVTTRDDMRTIQTGVAQLSWSSHAGLVLAAAMITSIIPLTVYFFGMDSIVEGMTAGAVKN